jgi:hypothetical protein
MAEPQPTSGSTPSSFSEQEKDSTIYLFGRMTGIWGDAKMSSLYPDNKAKMIARRQYAKRIGQFNRQQIDQALNYMAEKKSNDNHFEWPSVDDVLGVLKDLNRKRPLHQEWKRIESQPVTPEQHEKYMAELRAILNG